MAVGNGCSNSSVSGRFGDFLKVFIKLGVLKEVCLTISSTPPKLCVCVCKCKMLQFDLRCFFLPMRTLS